MSYSEKNGAIVSHYSRKVFGFTRTSDGSSKRAAIAACEESDREYVRAAEARAGKSLTTREILFGIAQEKAKLTDYTQVTLVRQKTAEDQKAINPYTGAIKSVNDKVARSRTEIAEKKRMLEMLNAKSAGWNANREAELAREAALQDPAFLSALESANARIERLSFSDDPADEPELAEAKARKAELEKTLDSGVYLETTKQADKRTLEAIRLKKKQQEQALAILREQVRSGEVELDVPPEAPPTNQPAPDSSG
jgi:hypothetical protein